MKNISKTVQLLIQVPVDNYCWKYSEYGICMYFDNVTTECCDLNIGTPVHKNGVGYHKPEECMKLEEYK